MNFLKINALVQKMPFSIRKRIYKKNGMKIGYNSVIGHGFFIDNPTGVSIGNDCLINYNNKFYLGLENGKIVIGDKTQIAYGCSLICVSHKIGTHNERAGKRISEPIHIGKG